MCFLVEAAAAALPGIGVKYISRHVVRTWLAHLSSLQATV